MHCDPVLLVGNVSSSVGVVREGETHEPKHDIIRSDETERYRQTQPLSGPKPPYQLHLRIVDSVNLRLTIDSAPPSSGATRTKTKKAIA